MHRQIRSTFDTIFTIWHILDIIVKLQFIYDSDEFFYYLTTLIRSVWFILYRLYRFHWIKLRFLVMAAAERGLQEIWDGFTNEGVVYSL